MISWELREMWAALLWALILGLMLGLLWDIIRLPRLMMSGRAELIAAFFGDILFFAAAGLIMTIFVFETCFGQARGYAIFGAGVGFTLWRLTFGRLTFMAGRFLRRLLGKILLGILHKVLIPIGRAISRAIVFLWNSTLGRLFKAIAGSVGKHRAKVRQKREMARLMAVCSGLFTKTEEEIYAFYTNEHSGKAGGLLRVRLSDNYLRQHTNKIQQSDDSAGRAERAYRGGQRLDRGASEQAGHAVRQGIRHLAGKE